MARFPMRKFVRWHIWLGWVAALPVLVWLISGLFMAARPIEEVRGESLKAAPRPVNATQLIFPQQLGPLAKVALLDQRGAPVWVVTGADKAVRRYSARDGVAVGPVAANEGRDLADATFTGSARLTELRRFSADHAPLDLRKPRPSWQASFTDGTHLYLDADSGEVLAIRTRWWRAYDFLWGLHIMDPAGRENSSNPWLWVFGSISLVSAVFGSVLLFRRRRVAAR